MLNIKQTFSPTQSGFATMAPSAVSGTNASNMTGMADSSGTGATGPTPIIPHSPKKSFLRQPKIWLSGLFMLVLAVGGVSAFYLSQTGQDLRQQATTYSDGCHINRDCDAGYKCERRQGFGRCVLKDSCTTSADCAPGQYCGGTAADGVTRTCIDNVQPTRPAPTAGNSPTPGGNITCSTGPGQEFPLGAHSCTAQGPGACVTCGVRAGSTGVWLSTPGECGDDPQCGNPTATPIPPTVGAGTPTPTLPPTGGSCAPGAAEAVQCTQIIPLIPTNGVALPAGSCNGYKTCHFGGGYEACTPNPGTNLCTYTATGGTQCTAACPSTMTGNMARCQCNNGVWTIGLLPPGGNCGQLCACTGNDCPTCNPTTPPTRPPQPTTPPAGPQCTNIQLLNAAGTPITGSGDQALKPGDTVKFSCSATGTVQHYEFQVILSNGQIETAQTNPALAAVGAITNAYTIPAAGKFVAQCRICSGPTTCQAYEDTGFSSASPR